MLLGRLSGTMGLRCCRRAPAPRWRRSWRGCGHCTNVTARAVGGAWRCRPRWTGRRHRGRPTWHVRGCSLRAANAGTRRPTRAAASRARDRGAACGAACRAGGGDREAGDLSHAPSLVRDPPARRRVRHPDVAELWGRSDVSTTMIYRHVLHGVDRGFGVRRTGWERDNGYCGDSCRKSGGGRTIPCK